MKARSVIAGLMMMAANAAMAADVTFEVKVTGAKSDAGIVRVNINADEQQFKGKSPALRELTGTLKEGSVTVKVPDLSAGKYSISVVHDENGNGKLDTNMLGMPTEAFGFSNDPKIRFGPPAFAETLIDVKDAQPVSIKLVTLSFGR